MYALIYDLQEPSPHQVEVLSVHRTREGAEKALGRRQHELHKRVWQCNARVVWVKGRVRAGDRVSRESFSTWRPGENIPEGELYSDTD